MDSNNITDITPLEKLTNLNILDLIYNQIKNTLPLVNNNGLGQGDAVSLTGNPLDSISVNQYIPALVARGVSVYL
jgi:Leucine-rich repeat (LRR) protein